MPYKNIVIGNSNSVVQNVTQQSQFYRGFSSVDPSNLNTKIYDLALIEQDLLNQFNTRRGERVMNPNYGSIIWDLLMEPLTPQVTQALRQDITRICNSDPRVNALQINLNEYDNGYILEITLKLVHTNQTTNMLLTFDQEIGLAVKR